MVGRRSTASHAQGRARGRSRRARPRRGGRPPQKGRRIERERPRGRGGKRQPARATTPRRASPRGRATTGRRGATASRRSGTGREHARRPGPRPASPRDTGMRRGATRAVNVRRRSTPPRRTRARGRRRLRGRARRGATGPRRGRPEAPRRPRGAYGDDARAARSIAQTTARQACRGARRCGGREGRGELCIKLVVRRRAEDVARLLPLTPGLALRRCRAVVPSCCCVPVI